MADAEVAVDGDRGHRQRRERDVGRDEEHVDLADEVVVDEEVDILHVDRERDDDEARDEVDEGQREDEQRRHEPVTLAREHIQDGRVAASSDDAEERHDHHDDVQFRSTRRCGTLVVRDVWWQRRRERGGRVRHLALKQREQE